jgi:AcrR family transcriptional regulator
VSGDAAAARDALGKLRAPRPLLPADAERALTPRQREVLDTLEKLAVDDGFAELTMAELAARANCSLRTLYDIAPRKEALLLMVVDRRLHRIGRAAMAAIEPGMDALTALRAYLEAATTAVGPTTEAFAQRLASVAGGDRLVRGHGHYVVQVTQRLLERAVAEGRIDPVDTGALALVLGGLGGFFSRPELIPRLQGTPKQTADAIMEIVLRGLERPDRAGAAG